MRFRTTARLLVVACVLGLAIWFLERRLPSSETRRYQADRILDMPAESIVYVAVESQEMRVECERREDGWHLAVPFDARATDAAIERLLSELEALRTSEVITAEQRAQRELTLADYGVSEPRLRVVVGDGRNRKELAFGLDDPLGELIYLHQAWSTDVISTSRAFLDAVPKTVVGLRDRNILRGDASLTARVEIHRPGTGFIRLNHAGGAWHLQQPAQTPADGGRVAQMLDALYSLAVEEFVWDPPSDALVDEAAPVAVDADPESRLAPYGLGDDEALVRVKVWTTGEDVGRELVIGRETGESNRLVFAKTRDRESICTIDREILDIFSVSVNDLRNPVLFPVSARDVRYACFEEGDRKLVLEWQPRGGWMVSEPVQWRADDGIVSELVGRLARLRAQRFLSGGGTNWAGANQGEAAAVIQLLAARPAAAAEGTNGGDPGGAAGQNRLLVGGADAETDSLLARFEGGDVVAVIDAEAIWPEGGVLTDPLVYRDRTMLAVDAANVIRVALRTADGEQIVSRNEQGEWTAASPAGARLMPDVVKDVLFRVANLRSLRIEEHDPKNLAAYGLQAPTTVLTLGLSGDEGIQKSILLGFRAKTDGIYAMVQGQDVVFVLGTSEVRHLTRSLVVPVDIKEDGNGD